MKRKTAAEVARRARTDLAVALEALDLYIDDVYEVSDVDPDEAQGWEDRSVSESEESFLEHLTDDALRFRNRMERKT